MESFDDTFAAELRALRPTPRPAFAAELDERAAAGFPRRRPKRGGESPAARLRAWCAGLTPRRALVAGGAMALVALVVATAVVAISQSETRSKSSNLLGLVDGGGGESNASLEPALRGAAPQPSKATPHDGARKGPQSSGGAAAEGGSGTVYEAELPSATGTQAAPAISGGAGSAPLAPSLPSTRNRDIERSASLVLGTTPDKLSEASSRVYEAVHSANGIVLHSSVHGNAREGEASFDLLIPTGKLNSALAAFSGIAEVRSRHDMTLDITAPTVSVSEELQDSNARIESLVDELGEAEVESEREAVEAKLRGERDRHASLRASLERLEDRASMSRVSLRIVGGHGAGVTPGGGGGDWGVKDALGDAGHILAVAGGVAIVGLAILGPIALILLAGWLVNRLRIRHLRERTLG